MTETKLAVMTPAEIDAEWYAMVTGPRNELFKKRYALLTAARKYEEAGPRYAKSVENYRAQADKLAEKIRAFDPIEAPYLAEWKKRNGWTRAYLVPDGHIHKTTACQSLYPTTIVAWLPEQSGWDEEKIVEAAGMMACTFCYPSAPVDALRAAHEAEKKKGQCPGSGTHEHDSSGLRYMSPRARCNHCGQTTSVTSTGKLRGHKPKVAA